MNTTSTRTSASTIWSLLAKPRRLLAALVISVSFSSMPLSQAASSLIKVDPEDIADASDEVKAILNNSIDEQAAWAKLEDLADKGDAHAQYLMGLAAARGLGEEPSMEKAEIWLRKADEQGNPAAVHALGQLLILTSGEQGPARIKEGLAFFEKSAAGKSLKSIHALGVVYSAGEVVEQNLETAKRWLGQGVEMKDPHSMYLMAMIYAGVYKGLERDDENAMKWLKAASAETYAPADMRIAHRYEVGYGAKRDLKQALEWYEKASKAGSGEASFKVGLMYKNGQGTEKDQKKALQWFKKGAELDFSEAANKVGICYEAGLGVDKDEKKALEYYLQAAKGGSSVGMFNLSVFYARGTVVKKDSKESFRWMLQAATAGLTEARHDVGFRYENGFGVERDYIAAAAWYGMAVKSNYVRSQLALAKIYEKGLGVERNMAATAQLYNRAAQLGSEEGMARLAAILEVGADGLKEDLVKAYVLYCRAAAKGHRPARERRDYLKKILTKSQLQEAVQIIEASKAAESERPGSRPSKLQKGKTPSGEKKAGEPAKEKSAAPGKNSP